MASAPPPHRGEPAAGHGQHLLRILGLLFVPAGVGIVASGDLVRAQWLPITGGVVCSTLLSLLVTAYVMKWLGDRQRVEDRQ
jgi:holin-like protein